MKIDAITVEKAVDDLNSYYHVLSEYRWMTNSFKECNVQLLYAPMHNTYKLQSTLYGVIIRGGSANLHFMIDEYNAIVDMQEYNKGEMK